MERIAIGVPAYGGQSPAWWRPLVIESYKLREYGIELVDVLTETTMATDANRNSIASSFLDNTDADWLWWIDADNPVVLGGIKRLLETGRKLVTGLYVYKGDEPYPVAYNRTEDGRYESLRPWSRGEIIPVDGAGLGTLLSHRDVYEEIRKQYIPMQRADGGIIAVHQDDIQGDYFNSMVSENDGKVIDGVMHQRVFEPTVDAKVPFFALEMGRTEDIGFFEKAKRVGFDLWVDTSVEVAHLTQTKKKPQEYFEWLATQKES